MHTWTLAKTVYLFMVIARCGREQSLPSNGQYQGLKGVRRGLKRKGTDTDSVAVRHADRQSLSGENGGVCC
jgi:hypothetical protein